MRGRDTDSLGQTEAVHQKLNPGHHTGGMNPHPGVTPAASHRAHEGEAVIRSGARTRTPALRRGQPDPRLTCCSKRPPLRRLQRSHFYTRTLKAQGILQSCLSGSRSRSRERCEQQPPWAGPDPTARATPAGTGTRTRGPSASLAHAGVGLITQRVCPVDSHLPCV